ncbi:DUF938 domain-containing protein [Corallincola spongiicola]|uniref:DUF938 domain-containing protein n=1 Tax=Corallincola spongiicola TaxID=2520508 RepID=A0ABY1WUA2_9GAMM|nr:DUF938 domain-containing protein [Corallincola spongiicola]TAA48300.1 DUF938 domain-containing protein [Corallincola spongiicola]
MSKRFSQSCENNKQPILDQLKPRLVNQRHLLEIGSGTGQHAQFFAKHLPHLCWQTSDRPDNHPSIDAWIAELNLTNLRSPLSFTIGEDNWPNQPIDTVFTANTAHIMQSEEVQIMMALVAEHLPLQGLFLQYGPFNIDGTYTSDSNHEFDQFLQQEGCGGIRDIAELERWAKGLMLVEQIAMPANNLLLVWRKHG